LQHTLSGLLTCVLQRVAVYFSVLQRVAVYFSELQRVEVMLQTS